MWVASSITSKNLKVVGYKFLGGDFNLPDIDWESSTVKGHQLPRRVNEEFISMQHDLAFEIIPYVVY
jgi:hypothetical protein